MRNEYTIETVSVSVWYVVSTYNEMKYLFGTSKTFISIIMQEFM